MLHFNLEMAFLVRLILIPMLIFAGPILANGQSFIFGPHDETQHREVDHDVDIVTDRPDFTEASSTVGQDFFQLETGYTYSIGDDGRTVAHSFPECLVRAGLWKDWFEVRVGLNFANTPQALLNNIGIEDLYVGTKLGIAPQHGVRPEVAIIFQGTLPTGSSGLSSDSFLPGANLLYGWDIDDRWSTAGSTQVNFAVDARTAEHFDEWAQSWTVGYAATDTIGLYSEWFMLSPHGATSAQTQHYFNGGLTFRPQSMLQFDVRAGTGLNQASDDYFVGAGMAVKFRRVRKLRCASTPSVRLN